jgi:hypothetical protein
MCVQGKEPDDPCIMYMFGWEADRLGNVLKWLPVWVRIARPEREHHSDGSFGPDRRTSTSCSGCVPMPVQEQSALGYPWSSRCTKHYFFALDMVAAVDPALVDGGA